MITDQQRRVYDFIRAYINIHGISPSYEEIAKGLNLKARGNIHRIVHKIYKAGMISIRDKRCRSIRMADKSVQTISAL
jgi:repressor LexA|tara:strand:+ start:245 stop:478 length:234 start_codon:yes stop_codon:yes gene_type:complete